jgi:hypothetical protein
MSGILSAQDTIFVKTGEVIPAVIVEKTSMEIKYKKFGMKEPAAIYSVFISDIKSIHYSDGIIADYMQSSDNTGIVQPLSAIEQSGTMKVMRLSVGGSFESFNRNPKDNLQIFWQNWHKILGTKTPEITNNPISYPFNLRMSFTLGQSGRNWMGDELQLILTPKDAISSSDANGTNEIMLRNFYYNIILFYGHTLNHKKTAALMIEPGLDIAAMSGHIKINNNSYNLSANLGMGFHIATGVDWLITKRLLVTARIGQRFLTIKEEHKVSDDPLVFKSFWVDPIAQKDFLSVKWNGPYFALGLSYNFYVKMKNGQAE